MNCVCDAFNRLLEKAAKVAQQLENLCVMKGHRSDGHDRQGAHYRPRVLEPNTKPHRARSLKVLVGNGIGSMPKM